MPQPYEVYICPLCQTEGMETDGFGLSLSDRWDNLQIAIGYTAAPYIIPILDKVQDGLDWLHRKFETFRKDV